MFLGDTIQPTAVCVNLIFHIKSYDKNDQYAILCQDFLSIISFNTWVYMEEKTCLHK